MLNLKTHIQQHAKEWGIKVDNLTLGLRSNMNYNQIDSCPLLSRVGFWFSDGKLVVVSRLVDKAMPLESVKSSLEFQQRLNNQLHYNLFPTTYDVLETQDGIVLFKEAINTLNYDIELRRAMSSPERSSQHFSRVIERQFKEMIKLFWHLEAMPDSPVLADLVRPNIFAGPRLVDQLTYDIDGLNKDLSRESNYFRFLVTYFYSPPMPYVFKDWLGALSEFGFQHWHTNDFDLFWSKVKEALYWEMKDKLEMYRDYPDLHSGLAKKYQGWTKRMVSIKSPQYGYFNQCQQSLDNQSVVPTKAQEIKRLAYLLLPDRLKPLATKVYGRVMGD